MTTDNDRPNIPDDNDPIKKQLLKLLERVKNAEVIIKDILGEPEAMDAKRGFMATDHADNAHNQHENGKSPLSLFIHDDKQLDYFIHRLQQCSSTKEWAQLAVYPLYENGDITAEVAKSKHFIQLTIPYCTKISTKNCNSLAKQLRKYCYFPR